MPRQAGVSDEWMEMLEDEIAKTLTAIDDTDEIRHVVRLLYQKNMISESLYDNLRERMSRIEEALRTGKKNTAALRNGRRERREENGY